MKKLILLTSVLSSLSLGSSLASADQITRFNAEGDGTVFTDGPSKSIDAVATYDSVPLTGVWAGSGWEIMVEAKVTYTGGFSSDKMNYTSLGMNTDRANMLKNVLWHAQTICTDSWQSILNFGVPIRTVTAKGTFLGSKTQTFKCPGVAGGNISID